VIVIPRKHIQKKGCKGVSLKNDRIRFEKQQKKKALMPKHASVGALISQGKKLLMFDRVQYPYGYACPAGHVEKDETPLQAIMREIKEETGLDTRGATLIDEEYLPWLECHYGFRGHHFYVYEVDCVGWLKPNPKEVRDLRLMTKTEIKKLDKQGKLEPVWKYFLTKWGWL